MAVPISLMRKLDKRGNESWHRLHSLTESLPIGSLHVLFNLQWFKKKTFKELVPLLASLPLLTSSCNTGPCRGCPEGPQSPAPCPLLEHWQGGTGRRQEGRRKGRSTLAPSLLGYNDTVAANLSESSISHQART